MWEKIMRQMTAKICQLKIFYESFSKTEKISNNDFPLYFHAASIYGFFLVLFLQNIGYTHYNANQSVLLRS